MTIDLTIVLKIVNICSWTERRSNGPNFNNYVIDMRQFQDQVCFLPKNKKINISIVNANE